MHDSIAIAADHAGFVLKEKLKAYIKNKLNLSCFDFGTNSEAPVDYPDFISRVANAVNKGKYKKGIVICGSGIGACIVANRYPNVRCALGYNKKIAVLSRLHNDANVLAYGGRFMSFRKAKKILKVWLCTQFSGEKRHKIRLSK